MLKWILYSIAIFLNWPIAHFLVRQTDIPFSIGLVIMFPIGLSLGFGSFALGKYIERNTD